MGEPAQSPALLFLHAVYSDRVIFAGFSYGETRAWRRWLTYSFTMDWWNEKVQPMAIGIPVDAKGNPTVSRHEVSIVSL